MTILITIHHDMSRHTIAVGPKDSPTSVVETFQRNLKKLGQRNGITWVVCR